jgi:hypothetical protein
MSFLIKRVARPFAINIHETGFSDLRSTRLAEDPRKLPNDGNNKQADDIQALNIPFILLSKQSIKNADCADTQPMNSYSDLTVSMYLRLMRLNDFIGTLLCQL